MLLPTLLLLGSLVWITATALLLTGTFLARRHFHPAWRDDSRGLQGSLIEDNQQPISILKPLKGIDAGLEENLRSFFNLDYPSYELLFSIADESDPAKELVSRLMAEHKGVCAALIIGAREIGPNPKVNNIVQSYELARHDWILVSDSNVRVKPDYLKTITREFAADVGVVTAVVRGDEPTTNGGYLESVFLNTFYARWMFLASFFGFDCVVGKSMLFRRSTADRFGGLAQLGRFLAEDYMTGRAMRMLGLRVIMMREPIPQPLPHYTFQEFWSRHLRWGRIRKAQAPLPVAIEPLFNSIVSGVMGAATLAPLIGISPVMFLAAHLILWLTVDMSLQHTLGAKLNLRTMLAWFAREILATPLWIHMICGETVTWRGTKLRVRSGGLLDAR